MSMGPMQINGILTRTQDFTALKHNEDMKPAMDQAAFQNTMQKTVERQLNQVQDTKETDTYQRRQDAKEKGKNEYQGDGGQKRRQSYNGATPDGTVIRKDSSRFDCSV